MTWSLDVAAWLHQYRREARATQERAEAAIALASEQGFPIWVAMATMLQGWALVEQGPGEDGVQQLEQGLAAWREMETAIDLSYFLALLAEARQKVGQTSEGLAALSEAFELVEKTGENFHKAELYRLQGELFLSTERRMVNDGRQEEAEGCFQKALAVARHQEAKALELRAAMSLARLWQQQGKKAEAQHLLTKIYNWFTEGFDTKDLQEAKALLEELS